MPTLMIQDRHLFSRVKEGIEQGGHQSIDLLSRPWNPGISEGVGDDTHQHALSTMAIWIWQNPGRGGPIQQIVTGLLQDIASQSSQRMPTLGSHLKESRTAMEPTIPQD